tara:strand:+ start:583 stop:741 length:159 start_codon:yes stop_codon:yes gene_type:complete
MNNSEKYGWFYFGFAVTSFSYIALAVYLGAEVVPQLFVQAFYCFIGLYLVSE